MSIVLMGSTSGSCTLQEQAVAGTTTLTLPTSSGTVVVNGVNGTIVSGTSVATTSGTAFDFTGIPSWAKRITVMLNGVSLTGSDDLLIQLGDSGGIETTGYSSAAVNQGGNTPSSTAAFIIATGGVTACLYSGNVVINNFNGNTWASSSVIGATGTFNLTSGAGSKTLSDVLTQVRITRSGTNTFDAGSINILYE
jgi:hypothetical protein